MKVKVIYPIRPDWREFDRREFDVGEVEAETPEDACELMFKGFNNVVENPGPGDIGFWSHKFKIRSMSVGDYIKVDGILYQCMACGFEKTEHLAIVDCMGRAL